MDFQALMEQAKRNSDKKLAEARSNAILSKPKLVTKISRPDARVGTSFGSGSSSLKFQDRKPIPSSSSHSSNASKIRPPPKPDRQPPSTVQPGIKKQSTILPGDIRYRGPPPSSYSSSKSNGLSSKSNGLSSKSNGLSNSKPSSSSGFSQQRAGTSRESHEDLKRPKQRMDPYKEALMKFKDGKVPPKKNGFIPRGGEDRKKSVETSRITSKDQYEQRRPTSSVAAAKMDFQTLMEQAKRNSDKSHAAANSNAILNKPKLVTNNKMSRPDARAGTSFGGASSGSKDRRSMPSASSRSSNTSKIRPPPKPDRPAPSTVQPGMKKQPTILPGDIRYRGPPPSSKSNGLSSKSNGFSSKSNGMSNSKPSSSSGLSQQRAGTSKQSYEDLKRPKPRMDPYKEALMKLNDSRVQPKKNGFVQRGGDDRRKSVNTSRIIPKDYYEKRRPAGFVAGMDDYSGDEEEPDGYYDEDDEYDSDMADFIDDTEMDDLERADFEESLKMINPRYDVQKWKMRERMIDDRRMDAGFRDIAAEERRSARIGLMEDVLEARKGSKGLG